MFNEYYARDTSRKIRSTFQSKGKSGKHLTGTVIYGYLWNEARDQWLVDPEAAEVVKRIFAMTIEGYGPYQIASKLKEEKILIPSAYLAQHGEGVNKNKTFKDVYGWGSSTICNLLEKREYLGHTINFKTRKHFKDKKSHYVPEDEWTIFENTHEAIIDQQTFDLVQKIRGNVRRYPDGWGEAAPLTGLLYCADCGGKMYVHRTNNGKRISQYTCSQYRTETDTWTDEDGTTHTDTYEVPYEYYILHVRLQNKTLPVVVNSLLDAEQKEIYDIMVPRIELNAGTINNNLMQVTVGDEYQITGGISNDLAVTGKDYGKCDRYLYISREAAVGDQAVYFQTDSKTVTPADSSLDIRLGNTSAANVTALTNASNSMGWNAPLATLWVQRDGAAKLTVGGLTLNDLPVYVLSLPVDETGKVLDASEAQVYAARKTNTGDTNPRDIDVTLPDVSGNGYAVAVVQPSQDHGTLVIQGPETIERNKTGEHYPVTYTVTYDMSESMESMIEQSGGEAEYVLTIDRDTRLVGNPGRFIGNPGRFNGESISVTYRLPHSEFRVGDVLLASAMLRITVGEGDYIIPSNVTKTRKVETTYSLTTQVNGGNGTISASKAGLAAGSHETIVFTPDSGYQIDTVTVNGVKAEVRSNMLEVIMDADKTVIVTYKGIPHVHNHGTAWKSDADNHWHECPCGDRKDVAAHSFKWVIDKEPTATRKGSKHEECTVCGYKKAAVVIPAKGSTVKPSDQPDKPGNTASANTGDSSDPVLWSALLFISGGAVIGTTVVSRKKKYNR